MNATLWRLACAAAILGAACAHAQSGQVLAPTSGPIADTRETPAAVLPQPDTTMILGAARAGKRLVAVGDRGLVLLSDDGNAWRQASSVPTRSVLTAVHFVDDRNGWAVGHWGVILGTQDGGEHWTLLRDDLTVDQPLFSVWFRDRNSGIACGLFSLLLETSDGGRTWVRVRLPTVPGAQRSDTNLFQVFPGPGNSVLLAGEQGAVFRSDDGGKSWKPLSTNSKGTLWAGVTLGDGSIVVAGLGGKVLRSNDGGRRWTQVESGTHSSITSLIDLGAGRLLATALDGVLLRGEDYGRKFQASQGSDATPLTATIARADGSPIVFSSAGVVRGP